MSDEQLNKEEDRMMKERGTIQTKTSWSLILGLPVLFAAIGLAFWQRRNSARENAMRILTAA
jgi:LPXTG-motif cell wall-anchored protein